MCPNRANIRIIADSIPQIIHIDGMCNECGNCGVFCPHIGNPYKDKLTLFWSEDDFNDSTNKGIMFLNENEILVRDENQNEFKCNAKSDKLSDIYKNIISALQKYYKYLIIQG